MKLPVKSNHFQFEIALPQTPSAREMKYPLNPNTAFRKIDTCYSDLANVRSEQRLSMAENSFNPLNPLYIKSGTSSRLLV